MIETSLLLIVATLIPMVLLIITYLLQKKQKNARTFIFKIVLFTNAYVVVFELINGYIINEVSAKIGLLILRTQWAAGVIEFFSVFAYNYIKFKDLKDIGLKELIKKYTGFKAMGIFTILYVAALLILPVTNYVPGVINYVHSPHMYLCSAYAVIVIIYSFILLIKKPTVTGSDKWLFGTEVATGGAYGLLQMIFTDIALSPIINSANILMMYMLIENPDIFISKELKKVEDQINRKIDASNYVSKATKSDIVYKLNNINNLIELYNKKEITRNELQAKFKNLNYEVKLLNSMVNNSTAIILPEEVDTTLVEIDVNQYLERFFELAKHIITKENVTFKINVLDSAPAKVLINTDYLYNTMLDQLLNALDTIEIGEISFAISGERIDNKFYLVSKCNDTGRGYSAEELAEIKNCIANKVDGPHLNKYIVYLGEISDDNNEMLEIESFEGSGSITTLKIEYTKIDDSKIGDKVIKETTSIDNNAIFNCNGLRALVLGNMNKKSNELLKLYNIYVDKTSDAKEAINLVKKGIKYEWIFINLAHPDGMHLAKALKCLNREYGYSLSYLVAIIPYKNKHYRALISTDKIFNDYIIEPLEVFDLNTVLKKVRRK